MNSEDIHVKNLRAISDVYVYINYLRAKISLFVSLWARLYTELLLLLLHCIFHTSYMWLERHTSWYKLEQAVLNSLEG